MITFVFDRKNVSVVRTEAFAHITYDDRDNALRFFHHPTKGALIISADKFRKLKQAFRSYLSLLKAGRSAVITVTENDFSISLKR